MQYFWYTQVMETKDREKTVLNRLAERLENDIHRRGLTMGDLYLTASKAAEQLNVSRMTANRALNVLAKRNMLTRHRSRGTFVGPGAAQIQANVAGYVHYLSFDDASPTSTLPLGEIVSGLQRHLPNIALQSLVVPRVNAARHVKHAIDRNSSDPAFRGFVASLATREVQQILADSGLPVVVFGSLYPGIDLPSVDIDQVECGRLLARRAIEAGFEQLVVLNRETWRQGDTLMLNGIIEAAQTASLGADAFSVRNYSPSGPALAAEINHLLDDVKRPTAIILRGAEIAETVYTMVVRHGMADSGGVGILYCDDAGVLPKDYRPAAGPLPIVRCTMSLKDQYVVLGQMLALLNKGQTPQPKRFIAPLE